MMTNARPDTSPPPMTTWRASNHLIQILANKPEGYNYEQRISMKRCLMKPETQPSDERYCWKYDL